MEYPELERMKKIQDESQSVGAFLDWLANERELTICAYSNLTEEFRPINLSIEKLLAEYFDIDLDKVEEEKRQLLDSLKH